MFHAKIGRFQLESKLELPLFSGFTVVPFNCVRWAWAFELQRSTAHAKRQKKLRQPRPADDVTKVTKGLQEIRQLIEWEDPKTNEIVK